jgi:hypothetical protein
MERRTFIKTVSAAGIGIVAPGGALPQSRTFISKRPHVASRKFTSQAVEQSIAEIKPRIRDEEIAWLFENCFPNTLDTTVEAGVRDGKPDSFVITGDIDALWLRDSTAQVTPYLPLARRDQKLRTMIRGLIHRQAYWILMRMRSSRIRTAKGGMTSRKTNPACTNESGRSTRYAIPLGCHISITS